jgi:hypothetical protein
VVGSGDAVSATGHHVLDGRAARPRVRNGLDGWGLGYVGERIGLPWPRVILAVMPSIVHGACLRTSAAALHRLRGTADLRQR